VLSISWIRKSRAVEILEKLKLAKIKVQDWNDDEIGAIREAVSTFKLKENYVLVSLNIKRLMDIGCYRGIVIELVFL
jgi:small subunit ribosomal protein S13